MLDFIIDMAQFGLIFFALYRQENLIEIVRGNIEITRKIFGRMYGPTKDKK